jgi:hypothetical protein
MSFAVQSLSPPVVGQRLGAPLENLTAGTVVLVTVGIPAAVADDLVLSLEADGVATGLAFTLPAGQTVRSVEAGQAVAAGAMLAWRVSAAGAPDVGATALSVHTEITPTVADDAEPDWQLLFLASGAVLAGDSSAALLGVYVPPAAMTAHSLQVTAIAGGGEATVFQLMVNGAAVDGLTLTLPTAERDAEQTVTESWSHAFTPEARLTLAVSSGPASAGDCVTDVRAWLRLTPSGE